MWSSVNVDSLLLIATVEFELHKLDLLKKLKFKIRGFSMVGLKIYNQS